MFLQQPGDPQSVYCELGARHLGVVLLAVLTTKSPGLPVEYPTIGIALHLSTQAIPLCPIILGYRTSRGHNIPGWLCVTPFQPFHHRLYFVILHLGFAQFFMSPGTIFHSISGAMVCQLVSATYRVIGSLDSFVGFKSLVCFCLTLFLR